MGGESSPRPSLFEVVSARDGEARWVDPGSIGADTPRLLRPAGEQALLHSLTRIVVFLRS